MDFDPDRIYQAVVDAGEDWADKKAAYEALDDVTKSVLADLTGDYAKSASSRTQAESMALASKPYKDHLAAVSGARRAWLMAQVKYEGVKMLAGLRQTQESTRRAEMKL